MRWLHTGPGALIPDNYHFNQLVCGAYCAASGRLFMVDGGAQFDGFFVVWEIDPATGTVLAARRLYGLTATPDSSIFPGPSIILDPAGVSFKFTGVGQILASRDTWLAYARQPNGAFTVAETPFDLAGGGQGARVGDRIFMPRNEDGGVFPNNKYLREFDLDLNFIIQYDLISPGPWALAYDPVRELFIVGFNGPDAITYSLATGLVQTLVNLTAVTQWRRAYYSANMFVMLGASGGARFFSWNGVDYDAETPVVVLPTINSSCPFDSGTKIAVLGRDGAVVPTLASLDIATMSVLGDAPTVMTANDLVPLAAASSEVALFNNTQIQIWDVDTLTMLQDIPSP